MNEIFEKIYNDNNIDLNESSALFEKVYTEAEMLNEMNPKLRALLAAGLIGTASLGAASCSMPTDDPTGYEQSAPETTNPVPTVTFESLGVTDYAESLARAVKDDEPKSQLTDISGYTDLIYKDGFVLVEFDDDYHTYENGEIYIRYYYEDGETYIRYIDVSGKVIFYIPIDMESDFDAAINAYNNAQ